jgi:FkbM family methyltransferase
MIDLLYWYIRKFPIRKGKIPILRFASKLGLFKGVTKIGNFGTRSKAYLLLSDWVQQLVFFFGVYEFEKNETKAWVNMATGSKFIFDIGSNFGYYSLLAAETNPDCVLHAFEPAPMTFMKLQKNVQLNGYTNIVCNNIGLSNSRGVLPLYLANDDNSGMTSLSKPQSFSGEVVNVSVEIFDEFINELNSRQVDLVKIDVEGNEFNVLNGMRNALSTCRPVVFIEILEAHLNRFDSSSFDVLSFFRALNYRGYEFDPKGLLVEISHPKDVGLAIFVPIDKSESVLQKLA